eukprot:gene14881-17070_t
MARANFAVVSMAIYLSKKIAECNQPKLRYSRNVEADGDLTPEGTTIVGRASACVENGVIRGKEEMFWSAIKTFSLHIIPTSAFFATFNYLLSELAIHIRSNVSTRLLSKFTTDRVYFQVINASQLQSIQPGQKVLQSYSNPDQVLTNDIEHFSYAVSGLFSHVMRPIVDILVNAERLYATSGPIIPAVMAIYLLVTSNVLNYIRSPVAGFTDLEQSLEGEYRALISRIATSAEEIAALEGGKNEETNVLKSLHPLLAYSRSFAQFRCNMTFIDSVVARYWLMLLGWRIVGVHFFQKQRKNDLAPEDLFRDYQNMSKTMLALSNAVGELIMSGRDVVKVFAYAEKLADFEAVMDEFIRRNEMEQESVSINSHELLNGVRRESADETEYESLLELIPQNDTMPVSVANVSPEQQPQRDCLVLQNVSIVPPNGSRPLHTGLNIIFKRKMHTIITGENGSGKSSLLRVLAGVWPAGAGRVVSPVELPGDASGAGGDAKRGPRRPVLYLPQKPYMSMGTLRQQIVYPEILPDGPEQDFAALDQQLLAILRTVRFSHLMHPSCYVSTKGEDIRTETKDSTVELHVERSTVLAAIEIARGKGIVEIKREQNKNSGTLQLSMVKDWSEVLSGGEKQRLSLARLFYHQPLFALLDESTSAVSQDVEEALIAACVRELDTTLITIAHRPHLKKYHQFELHLTKNNEH